MASRVSLKEQSGISIVRPTYKLFARNSSKSGTIDHCHNGLLKQQIKASSQKSMIYFLYVFCKFFPSLSFDDAGVKFPTVLPCRAVHSPLLAAQTAPLLRGIYKSELSPLTAVEHHDVDMIKKCHFNHLPAGYFPRGRVNVVWSN